MKKLEGIITVTGILLIIGLPMFLLFAGTDTSKISADSERLISINSYSEEKAVVKTIDIDSYEEDFDVLDGSKAREEIEIIDSLTPLAAPEIIENAIVVGDQIDIEETLSVVNENEETNRADKVKEKLISVLDAITEEDIEDYAVPEWLDISNSENTLVEGSDEIVVLTTVDTEEEELISFVDTKVPQGLDDSETLIFEEIIIEEDGGDLDHVYEPESNISLEELAAYDSTDEEIEINSEVLIPEALEGGNIIDFECSELDDGYGTKAANVTFVNDDGVIVHSNFAY